MRSLLALIILCFIASPARAEMGFPLKCLPGRNCWILSYPDLNGKPNEAQDYACGPGTEDGDVFLRLALMDIKAIADGMPVLAADDGKVVSVLDGIDDRIITSRAELKTGTPNCGNGIVIDHGRGLESAYCHLKKGSISVQKNQMVRKGEAIAMAGQSGLATWPQLGFTIRKGGYFIDPITSNTVVEGCGFKPRPAISLPPEFYQYQPVAIVGLGFSTGNISGYDMAMGNAPLYAMIDREEKTINMWAMVLGVHKGDEVEIRIRDPRGRTFYYDNVIMDADAARQPINATRDRGFIGWRTGPYTGEVRVTRTIDNRPYTVSRQVIMLVK